MASVYIVWQMSNGESTDDGRIEHDDGAGPLSLSTGYGGFTMWAPGGQGFNRSWWGSFGGMTPCLAQGTEPATIEDIELVTTTEPLDHYFVVRTVRARDIAHAKPRDLMVHGSLDGRPERARPLLIGRLSRKFEGLTVTRPCTTDTELDQPGDAELFVVLRSGSQGAEISGMDVTYRVGERPYTLRTHWEMRMCGTRMPDSLCSQE